jgi:hypothetical protein
MSGLSVVRRVRSVMLVGLAGLLIASCGSSSPASSPLDTALSYFPKDSPFVMSIVTDPNSPAIRSEEALTRRLPLATFGQALLSTELAHLGINYDTDLRPLFGNPLFLGLTTTTGSGAKNQIVFAWVTKDAGTLSDLIQKLKLKSVGSHDGATLYQASTIALAVSGSTLLAGSSTSALNDALDLHARGGGLGSSDYNRETAGLPQNSLVAAFGYLGGVLSRPSAASARRIPWVAALRGYGVAISAGTSGLTFQYRLDTSGAPLSSSQLPIAPGTSPPGLAGTLPILAGIREPATTLRFLLNAERLSSPSKYAADIRRVNAVRRKTGVDLNRDVIDQLGNNAGVQSDGHAFMVRVDVKNTATAARTLRRLGTSALDLFGTHPGARVTLGPGGLETVHRAGKASVLFGIVGNELVAGTATPAQLRSFASLSAPAATGLRGAVAFKIGLPQLVRLALKQPSRTVQLLLSMTGDITGWLSASSSAFTGSATLALK